MEAPRGNENLEAVIDTPKNSELSTGQATTQNTPVAPEPRTAQTVPVQEPVPEQPAKPSTPIPTTTVTHPHGDLAAANAKIQETKRKKLDKIMARLSEKGQWFDGFDELTAGKLTTSHE